MARPLPTLHGFVGQRSIVETLQAHVQGATSKSEPLPPTLLTGPTGVGKTELAKAIAWETRTNFIELYSPSNPRKWQVIETLRALKPLDVAFIDEIHAFPYECQEILYPAIDSRRVPEVDADKHRIEPDKWVDIAPFTLIAATDQPGTLRKALKSRFVMQFHMDYYNVSELRQIVLNRAADLGILLTPQAATRLAEAARGLPRLACRRLDSYRIWAQDLGQEVTRGMIDRYLDSLGISETNLTSTDMSYLKTLRDRGGRASLDTLALQLNLDAVEVKFDLESYLVRRGLIGIERGGRVLTEQGRQILADGGLA